MNNIPFNRVLVLSPHADDAELGAGGTIARLAREGAHVWTATFSFGNPETGSTLEELTAALTALGCLTDPVDSLDPLAECRHFHEYRQQILDLIIKQREYIKPQLVIAPSVSDAHQDHQVIAAEAIRACKGLTLWAYEQPWNTVKPFRANVFVSLTSEDARAKIDAVHCYKSQRGKLYTQAAALGSTMVARGLQAGVPKAEAFEVVRWVI